MPLRCSLWWGLSIFLLLWVSTVQPKQSAARAFSNPAPTSVSESAPDPNRAASEFNHHVAGWALIGVAFLVLGAAAFPQFRALRFVWPALFLLAGLFLALWSDGEIWPRGNLSWGWLLHHDAEARQHKVYAFLLIAMGLVEYLRAAGRLPRLWRIWAFPVLAVLGAGMLLVHDHSGSSGAHSPEARPFLVNPALDVDGRQLAIADPPAQEAMPPAMDHGMAHDMTMDPPATTMDHSTMNHSVMDHPAMADDPAVEPAPHHHHMTPSMLLVEREHFWFMIVGLGVVLFKFISDSGFWSSRVVAYLWPIGMAALGILLIAYRE